MLKLDIFLLGRLDNGLGFYRFSYNGSTRPTLVLWRKKCGTSYLRP
jgi:hypothetical protein